MRGHHGLVALTGEAGRIDEVEEAPDLVPRSRIVAHHREIDRAFEFLGGAGLAMLVCRGIDVTLVFSRVFRVLQDQGWSADLGREFSADLEQGVADGFGFEALAVHAPEQAVLRVEAQARGVVGAAEAISVAEDESAEEALLRPALGHEACRQVIQ